MVAPVRNGERFLPSLLRALDAQTLGRSRFEVILVDDGSTDGTPRILNEWSARDPERRRVVPGPERGPAGARNVGIRHARGEWIASTDADTAPDRRWLEALLATAAARGAQAVEGAIEASDPVSGRSYGTIQRNLQGGRFMTGNMLYRRELLERLGGFDERFREAFLEDSDLAFRILDAGHEIPFAPDAFVLHPVVDVGPREVLRRSSRLHWLALFAAKHPQRYRVQLRPHVRPLYASDLHVLAGLGAAVAAVPAGGVARALLALAAAHGVARGLAAHGAFSAPRAELPSRALLAVSVPPLKAGWWLAGCIRFRKVAW